MNESMTKHPRFSFALLPLAVGLALPAVSLQAQDAAPAKKSDVRRFTSNFEAVGSPVPTSRNWRTPASPAR